MNPRCAPISPHLLRTMTFARRFLGPCTRLGVFSCVVSFAWASSSPDSNETAPAAIDASSGGETAILVVLGALALAGFLTAFQRFARRGMNRWTVARRLQFGFGTILVVLMALAIESYLSLHHALVDFRSFQNRANATAETVELLTEFFELDLTTKDLALTRDPTLWAEFELHHTALTARIRWAEDTFPAPALQARLRTIAAEVTAFHRSAQTLLQAITAEQTDRIPSISAALARSSDTLKHEVEQIERDLLHAQNLLGDELAADIGQTQRNVIAFALAAAVLGLGLALILTRSITRPLSHLASALGDGARQTATAAGQVSGSSQTLAEGASEQAASVEETAATIEELSAMARRNTEHTDKAHQIVANAQDSATRGGVQIDALKTSMADIQHASQEVTAIIKTIDEIAFQTNILALNASVEAARAGEAGAGFAVVADEVRALAQRSADAARETASRIECSVAKGRHGTETSKLVADHFTSLQQDIAHLNGEIAEIARATQEQDTGITQLNHATAQIDQVTQTNASAAEETAAAAEELSAQATFLQEAVETLCTLCGVSQPATATPVVQHRSAAPRRQLAWAR